MKEDSRQLTKKDTDTELGRKTDFIDQIALRSAVSQHKKYGNMLVVLETDRILITLGPNYLCFLSTFTLLAIGGFFLAVFVNKAFDSIWIKIVNILFVVVQLLSYLAVAVSNPGIVLQQNLPSQQTNESDNDRRRYCLKCGFRMYKNMYHCKSCDVCIRNHDHHCLWISKCIGGGNINRFNFFVSITPLYIIYFIIMIVISLAISGGKRAQI